MPDTKKIIGDADCDDILGWLDAHSVSLSQGLPLNALMQKWRKAGRNEYRLGASLKKLFERGLVVRVSDVEPPHLRMSVKGYARLIGEPMPDATIPAPAVAAIATAPTLTPGVLDSGMFKQPIAEPGFLQHGQPLTELALRNQVLAIYRDLHLGAEGQLIAMSLSRYWQENGLRVGDLRLGLDVLLRDGYLRQRLDGIDVFWVLTPEGEAYMNAPPAHPVLLQLSPAVSGIERRPGDTELQHMVLHAWAARRFSPGGEMDYPALMAHWRRIGFDDNALLHALDWLVKRGSVLITPGQPPGFQLTISGADYARAHLRSG